MSSWADNLFAKMSLEEKVGQLICFRASKHASETIEMAGKGLVGFVSPGYYDGMRDIRHLTEFMNELQKVSPIPVMFIGNHVCELPQWSSTPFPGENCSMLFAATRNMTLVREAVRMLSRESKAAGFDCVWTPVVDVNTNPRNPIIGTRAYSDRPELVTETALAVMLGMQEERLLPTAKHFPGHGDTDFDTHLKAGVINHDRKRLDAIEFYPYRILIDEGLRGIETAHLAVPSLDPTAGLPATFSRRCIYDILRLEMGFNGLIVSDSLSMNAIRENFSVEEAVIKTFNAGHDVILQDYQEPPMPTFECLLNAVKTGIVPLAELNASVIRVLEGKEWALVHKRKAVNLENLRDSFKCPDHIATAQRLYEESVTVLELKGLPFKPSGSDKICIIATSSGKERNNNIDLSLSSETGHELLFREFRQRLGSVQTVLMSENPDPSEMESAIEVSAKSSIVIFAVMLKHINNEIISETLKQGILAEKLIQEGKHIILCVFGTPYIINSFPCSHVCLTTYSSMPFAIKAGIKVLFGEIPSRGKLPVTLDNYPFGYGL